MTCEQCKYITVCMAQADCLGQIFDPNYDGEHGCTDVAPCTNADRIRSMSDEELAEYLYSIQNAECELRFCKNKAECVSELDKGQTINDSECKKCLVDWLQ